MFKLRLRTVLALPLALGIYPVVVRYGGGANVTLASTTEASAQGVTSDPDPNFVPSSDAIPGEYLVTFATGAYTPPYDPTPSDPTDSGGSLNAGASNSTQTSVGEEETATTDAAEVTDVVCAQYGATVDQTFAHVGSFSCVATESQARAMSHDARVEAVEANARVYGTGVQTNPGWGLDRIDQTDKLVAGGAPPNGQYTYTRTGANVDAWIVDSGIAPDCNDLGNSTRLIQSFTAFKRWNGNVLVPDFTDYIGHGTAVAGVIGGTEYGVAKGVRFRSVCVLDANNKADIVKVVSALDYIRGNLPAGRRSVVNMSLIFYSSTSKAASGLKKAIDNLLSKKVIVVVAAGNERVNVGSGGTKGWPASLTQVITVGATDINDAIAQYNASYSGSNYGSVIDVFAPGKDVPVWIVYKNGNGTRYNARTTYYGTSFAAPYVAGVVAQYLEANPTKSANDAQSWIKDNAKDKVILDSLSNTGTTKRMLKTTL